MGKEGLEYLKQERLHKVTHFLKVNNLELEKESKVFLLKTINEKSGNETKDKLIRLLNSKNIVNLALLKSESTFYIDEFDIGASYVYAQKFYDLYLVTNISDAHYFIVIQENNFFKTRANFELLFLKKKEKFYYKFYFLNRKKLT